MGGPIVQVIPYFLLHHMTACNLYSLSLLVAYVMSGCVAMEVYMNDPTPARQGIVFIFCHSPSDCSDMDLDRVTFGLRGIDTIVVAIHVALFQDCLNVCSLRDRYHVVQAVSCDSHTEELFYRSHVNNVDDLLKILHHFM